MASKEFGPTDSESPLLSGGFSADTVVALRQAARELKFSVKQLVEAGGQHPVPGGGLSEVKPGQAFIQIKVNKQADFANLWKRADEIKAQSVQQAS